LLISSEQSGGQEVVPLSPVITQGDVQHMACDKLIGDLIAIHIRLIFNNTAWDSAIKSAFMTTGSFDFLNLPHKDLGLVDNLVVKFKLVRKAFMELSPVFS